MTASLNDFDGEEEEDGEEYEEDVNLDCAMMEWINVIKNIVFFSFLFQMKFNFELYKKQTVFKFAILWCFLFSSVIRNALSFKLLCQSSSLSLSLLKHFEKFEPSSS